MSPRWTAAHVPDQHGRTAVITGGNTGLGFVTARVLAARGATVVLACRDPGRATAAAGRIRAAVPGAAVETLHLDLASQASVREAARRLPGPVDLLINNAGALFRHRSTTEDGHERTLATNHLGPFAFTGLVLDRLLTVPGSRVVTVTSLGHRYGTGVINFDDLHHASGWTHTGANRAAYFQSKLANLMFTYELQRRLDAAGAPTIATAAHPGNARTEFPRDLDPLSRAVASPRLRLLTWWLLQSAEVGALAILRAATDPDARGGDLFGPGGRHQFVGHPVRVASSPRSHDTEAQRRLWGESERLTGVTYAVP
ncbi:oxidoreductase [Catenuloplanes atrovinosus]|uniref:NAD(P)-dependent dehydrogenase (Short-subunit alcohol dehydrogenase family) n=1 Tax=Catenuloplanes atrovinosus TaxID=137266 RepID=A0AAE3YSC9_9ACTN|nr:oxidoreductase [Catenuloplanes atrovinosus]MDR7279083.1 NAD(P)-dependent dehydrogenase (short-subunit alcohol dehydrogenase family) [Catenuloplanes atrovinosus]